MAEVLADLVSGLPSFAPRDREIFAHVIEGGGRYRDGDWLICVRTDDAPEPGRGYLVRDGGRLCVRDGARLGEGDVVARVEAVVRQEAGL